MEPERLLNHSTISPAQPAGVADGRRNIVCDVFTNHARRVPIEPVALADAPTPSEMICPAVPPPSPMNSDPVENDESSLARKRAGRLAPARVPPLAPA